MGGPFMWSGDMLFSTMVTVAVIGTELAVAVYIFRIELVEMLTGRRSKG